MGSIENSNHNRYRISYLLVLGAVAFFLIDTALYYKIALRQFFPYRDFQDFLLSASYNFPPIVLIFLSNYFVVFKWIRIKQPWIKLMSDAALSTLMLFAIDGMDWIVVSLHTEPYIDITSSLVTNIMAFLIMESMYLIVKYQETLRKEEENRRLIAEQKYAAIKSQVNPHFLFNSLNILNSLIALNPSRAQKFTCSLSAIYRQILRNQDAKTVTLENEIRFTKAYVDIISNRFVDLLHVTIQVKESYTANIIPYSLQILIENAIKHNDISEARPMEILISSDEARVAVANSKNLKADDKGEGIGLQYLDRMYGYYGRHINIEETENSYKVEIPLL